MTETDNRRALHDGDLETSTPRQRSRRSNRANGTTGAPVAPVCVLVVDTTYKPWPVDDGTDHKCAKYTEEVAAPKAAAHSLFTPKDDAPKSAQKLQGKAIYPMYDALRETFLASGVTVMPSKARVTIEFFA